MPENPVIQTEARLKDFISSQLKTIEGNLKNFADSSAALTRKQTTDHGLLKSSVKDLASSWDIMKISATGAVGAMGAMAILNKVTAFLSESSKAAKEAAAVDAQLESATGKLAESYRKFATLQMEKRAYDDEEIKMAMVKIDAVVKNEEATKNLTEAAMNMAAATGMALPEAAFKLAKAVNDGSTSIRGTTLVIKEASTKEEAYKNVMAAVNKEYGNRADAIAATDTGKLTIAANKMKEMQETIGKEILPLQLQWNEAVLTLVKTFSGPLSTALKVASTDLRLLTEGKMAMLAGETIAQAKQAGAAGGGLVMVDREIKQLEEKRKIAQTYYDDNMKALKAGSQLAGINAMNAQDQIKDLDKLIAKVKQAKEEISKPAPTTSGGVPTAGISGATRRDKGTPTKSPEERVKEFNDYTAKAMAEEEALISKATNNILASQDVYYRQISEAERSLAESKIQLYEDEALRKKELLLLQQQEEMLAIADNYVAQEALAKAHTNQLIALQREVGKDNAEQARKNKQVAYDKMRTEVGYGLQIGETLLNASKASANARKGFAMVEAGINTALAVTRALALGNKFEIPLIIALGLAQQAAIANAKYKTGTNYAQGGRALVGEDGAELVDLPSGSKVYNSNETKNMYGGTTVNLVLPPDMPVDQAAANRIEGMLPRMLERLANELKLETFKSTIGVS